MDRCSICHKPATAHCAKCHQPICRAHEYVGLNERNQPESLCPQCAERLHQDRLRKRR